MLSSLRSPIAALNFYAEETETMHCNKFVSSQLSHPMKSLNGKYQIICLYFLDWGSMTVLGQNNVLVKGCPDQWHSKEWLAVVKANSKGSQQVLFFLALQPE